MIKDSRLYYILVKDGPYADSGYKELHTCESEEAMRKQVESLTKGWGRISDVLVIYGEPVALRYELRTEAPDETD